MLRVPIARATYHHGNLQSALEDAALSLLESQPAAKISLREVARLAGVSHNAPYNHFGDRAALLHALGVRAMRDLVEVQERAVETETDPVSRVRALGVAYVGYAAEHPQAFALVFDPEYCPPGALDPELDPLVARNAQLLRGEVAALLQLPRFEGRDPTAMISGLWASVHGMAVLVMLGHLPREVAEQALAALLG
jgi:AcrR family transcriptional regulator